MSNNKPEPQWNTSSGLLNKYPFLGSDPNWEGFKEKFDKEEARTTRLNLWQKSQNQIPDKESFDTIARCSKIVVDGWDPLSMFNAEDAIELKTATKILGDYTQRLLSDSSYAEKLLEHLKLKEENPLQQTHAALSHSCFHFLCRRLKRLPSMSEMALEVSRRTHIENMNSYDKSWLSALPLPKRQLDYGDDLGGFRVIVHRIRRSGSDLGHSVKVVPEDKWNSVTIDQGKLSRSRKTVGLDGLPKKGKERKL